MEKKETADKAMQPIENFMADRAIHEAVCLRKGWADGKCMTKADYDKAVADFLNAPAGSWRRKGKK